MQAFPGLIIRNKTDYCGLPCTEIFPYFRQLKEILDAGLIGEIMSIQHMEPIGHIHMSHSYQSGKWRNSKFVTLIILAKSSNDTDILRWLADYPVNDPHGSITIVGL